MKPNILLILVVILIVAYFASYEKLFYITVGAVAVSAVGEIKVFGGVDYNYDEIRTEFGSSRFKKEDIEAYILDLQNFAVENSSEGDDVWSLMSRFNKTVIGARRKYDMHLNQYVDVGELPHLIEFASTPLDVLKINPKYAKKMENDFVIDIHKIVYNPTMNVPMTKSANKQ
jgi:hypothetical protein